MFSAGNHGIAEAALLHIGKVRCHDLILIYQNVRYHIILFGIIGDMVGVFRRGFAPQFIQVKALGLLQRRILLVGLISLDRNDDLLRSDSRQFRFPAVLLQKFDP